MHMPISIHTLQCKLHTKVCYGQYQAIVSFPLYIVQV